MLDRTTVSGFDIIMGDFNTHHPSWSGPLYRGDPNRVSPRARLLEEGMTNANMVLMTTPGSETFVRGQGRRKISSTLDLSLVSSPLEKYVDSCEIYEQNPWSDSDHRASRMALTIDPSRDKQLRYLWDKVDKKLFISEFLRHLLSIPELKDMIVNATGCNTAMDVVIKSLQIATDRIVPTIEANPPPKTPMNHQTHQFLEGDGIPSAGAEPPHVNSRTRERRLKRATKPNRRRDYLHSLGESQYGTWKAARLGKRWAQSRITHVIPTLVDESGVEYTTDDEKIEHFFDMLWKGRNTPEMENMTVVPYPTINPEREELAMDLSVTEAEVKRLINESHRRKAPGLDTVPFEALKIVRDEIAPYLAIIFQACLSLSYFPDCCKSALMIIIQKMGQLSYNTAKSHRPIALLAAGGKLLEKLLANRLKKVAVDHSLLPASQYGAPGRSTVECLRDLLRIIHRDWNRKKVRRVAGKLMKMTKMGLDIAGAFDRVNRALVLQALADKGIPEPFIRMMQSFLSGRDIRLKLPGVISGPTRINIGIPQGSPLSPLLFLFFVAPLLERLEALSIDGAIIIPFAYMDDTYVVVRSESYRDNCSALEKVHRTIDQWAQETGTEFSPKKYTITHFKDPEDKGADCKLVPNIPGIVDNDKVFKNNKVKILGVILDPRLGFEAHVNEIRRKVRLKLRILKLIARRKVGLTVHKAREFFLGCIMPIIAYACPAWFFYSPEKTMPQSLKRQVDRLESIQYEALKVVTGFFGRTSKHVVMKEMYIPSIRVYLYEKAQVGRAMFLEMQETKPYVRPPRFQPSPQRQYKTLSTDILDEAAYTLATRAAETLLSKKGGDEDEFLKVWRVRDKRKKAIKALAREDAERRSAQEWNKYRCQRADSHSSRHRPVCIKEDWGPENLRLYEGLRRGESTLLLELRTEKIALNGPLFDMGIPHLAPPSPAADHQHEAQFVLSPACTCGHRSQTVYHMFMRCPELDGARQKLVDRIGALDWNTLLTVHAKLATQWAMVYFPLGAQYDHIREDSPFYDRYTMS
ncbi:hypothetical protein FSST1_002606 [Fusarium sambucinum]